MIDPFNNCQLLSQPLLTRCWILISAALELHLMFSVTFLQRDGHSRKALISEFVTILDLALRRPSILSLILSSFSAS
ncbi:hypothetical protein BDV12DRAFT_46539 [Aspergillus spectabilis]